MRPIAVTRWAYREPMKQFHMTTSAGFKRAFCRPVKKNEAVPTHHPLERCAWRNG